MFFNKKNIHRPSLQISDILIEFQIQNLIYKSVFQYLLYKDKKRIGISF